MMRWRERLHDLRRGVVWALGRFPVSVLALGFFALLVNLEIAEIVRFSEETLGRTGIALVGAAMLAGATVLFGERHGFPAILRHVASLVLGGAVGAALWYWEWIGIAFPALLTATILAVPLAPYIRREARGFWDFIWHLIHAAALAVIAIGVFCAGLSAILASIDYLFGIDIKSSIYAHVWSIGLGFVGPVFALSLVPTVFPEEDTPRGIDIFVAGIRILSDFVAVPLLAVYVAILHLYALKIAVEGELPKGQIGWMVLSFGMAVMALRVVVHPMGSIARAPTRLFLRYWALGLIVPLGLLLIAVRERIVAYGVTPERYSLALFAIFLGLVLLAQIPPRLRGDIRLIPALGALALLFGSFGPWGMFEVSARSQMERLTTALASAGAIENGVLVIAPSFTRDEATNVRSMVDVLVETRQLQRLKPLFAGRADDPLADAALPLRSWERRQRVWEALNVKELPAVAGDGTFTIAVTPAAIAIDGYDIVFTDQSFSYPKPVRTEDGTQVRSSIDSAPWLKEATVAGLPLRVAPKEGEIDITLAGRAVTLQHDALREIVAKRLDEVEKQSPEGARPPFFVELRPEGVRIGLLISSLSGKLTDNAFELYGGSFDLYLRRSDWQAASGGEALPASEP